MDKETLRKVQLIQLDIAKEVMRICKMHDISFFLDGGTLLGAIRHNRFIPWDDDLDLGMVRKDYDRFLEIAEKELSSEYLLQTWQTDKGYGMPYAKIQKRDTVYIEKNASKIDANHGIFIDIFPFDNYPDDQKMQKIQGRKISFYKIMLRAKCNYANWYESGNFNLKKYLGYIPVRILSLFYSKEHLIKQYSKYAVLCNMSKSKNKFPQGISHYGKFVIPNEMISCTMYHLFEDTEFPIPVEYDNYLTLLYGDYMTLPPENERTNRHGIIKIDLGISN